MRSRSSDAGGGEEALARGSFDVIGFDRNKDARDPLGIPLRRFRLAAAFGYLLRLIVNIENEIGTQEPWQAPFASVPSKLSAMRSSTPSDRAALPGGLDHGSMRGLLGYNLAQAAIPSFKIFKKRIGEPFQLRRIDFTILMLVASNPNVTQRHVAPRSRSRRRA